MLVVESSPLLIICQYPMITLFVTLLNTMFSRTSEPPQTPSASIDMIEAELAKSSLFRYNNRNDCHLRFDNDDGESSSPRN